LAAVAWVAVYLFRQRRREQEATAARQRLEEARRLALENELRRQRAEQEALQLRSQIFAQLAVLAGCYAPQHQESAGAADSFAAAVLAATD
jgi:hypothetical protein